MANNTISQIKIDNTIYDICDYESRKNLSIFNKVNCSVNNSKTIPSKSSLSIVWDNKDIDVTNLTYIGYSQYNTGSQDLFVISLSVSQMELGNKSSSSVTTIPEATQLYLEYQTL